MLSSAEIARIRADIAMLEKAYESCTDTGIRKIIESSIKEQKDKLESERRAS
jgi:hypothetical protein